MEKLRLFCLLAAVVIVSFCNKSAISTNASYSPGQTPSSCAILLPAHIGVYYQGNVENEFGKGDKKVLIDAYFRKAFREEVERQGVFLQVFTGEPSNDYRQRALNVKTKTGMKTMFVPASGKKIECREGTADIVVALDEVEILSHFEGSVSHGGYMTSGFGGGMMMMAPSFSSSKDLIVKTKFVVYDNRIGEVVSHGFLEVVDKNSFAVSMSDWQNVLYKTGAQIIGSTPFGK